MALLTLFSRLRPLLKKKISVAHIHHGHSTNTVQEAFRDQAWNFVKKQCQNFEVPFLSNIQNLEEKRAFCKDSEESMRAYRYQILQNFQGKEKVLCLAHHQGDLLETQLIHLIRGSGVKGLKSLVFWDEEKRRLRPFLSWTSAQVEDYVSAHQVPFVEDPSNSSVDPFRNWLRKLWLPQLEAKRPGSLKSLARSLELLAHQGAAVLKESFWSLYEGGGEIEDRFSLQKLPLSRQKEVLADFMHALQAKAYTQNHIEEVLKRLDRVQNNFEFSLLKYRWVVSGPKVKVVPLS